MKIQPLKLFILFILYFINTSLCFAELEEKSLKISFPFDTNLWSFTGNAVVEDFMEQKALKLGAKQEGDLFGYGTALLKDQSFANGIIEYDIAFDKTQTYAGLQFRIQQNQSYENFYMRAEQSGKADANQYMPVYNGIPSWQLYYGEAYGVPSDYVFNQWMHIKVVVANKLADIYIRDMQSPVLTVLLKQQGLPGGIGLWGLNIEGDVRFANFKITPLKNPEIKGTPKQHATTNLGNIPTWTVSDAFNGQLLDGKTLLTEEFKRTIKDKKRKLKYIQLHSEPTGMNNLAKIQGVKKGQDTVFAKVLINSETEQIKKFEFGFSDRVKVYLNNQLLFEGNDAELSRDYRFLGTVGFYDALYLALKKGKNELLFAVSESVDDPTGWAIQGRFENMQGITLKTK